jgi:acetolactate synthase-1/2/3 large subunit
VNYAGDRGPELILTTHEEIAVALAHGYAKARGRPMAAVVRDIVAAPAREHGHFQRLLRPGADAGPGRRRPHGRVQAQAVDRWRLARTEPAGPVYLCLDAALQEEPLARPVPIPDAGRFEPASAPHADPRAIEEAARRLVEARAPAIVVELLGRRAGVTASLCRLAELLGAPMVDLSAEYSGRPSVPSVHPLDLSGARHEALGDADVVLALDVSNLLGARGVTDRSTREVRTAIASSTPTPTSSSRWSRSRSVSRRPTAPSSPPSGP